MSSIAPFPDMGPVPRVELVVDPGDLLTDTVTVDFERRAEDRTFKVRGGMSRSATTTAVVMDYEAPFQIESVYSARCMDEDGAYMGTVTLDATTLAFGGTVIQQPFDPKLAVEVVRLAAMAGPVRQSTPGDLVRTENSGLPTLIGTGIRGGVEGFTLAVRTDTLAAYRALQATLGTYEQPQLQAWLIRTPPPILLPRVFFCAAPSLDAIERTLHFGEERVEFTAVVTEIEPPAPGLSPAVLRYSDLVALFDSYSDIAATYTLYSDILRDQSLVGAAG
ncbi:hypothetical protein [Microbacterium sp.]|uniref:hypothetical protein n=1 Tax=Microbacterium sp. TaxID=51671 RepID=UPI003F71F4B9